MYTRIPSVEGIRDGERKDAGIHDGHVDFGERR